MEIQQQESFPTNEWVTECWNCRKFKTAEQFTKFDEECKTNPNARQSCDECREEEMNNTYFSSEIDGKI